MKFWLSKGELENVTKHKSVLRDIHGKFSVALVAHVCYYKNYSKSKKRQEQSLALRFIPAKNANEMHMDL